METKPHILRDIKMGKQNSMALTPYTVHPGASLQASYSYPFQYLPSPQAGHHYRPFHSSGLIPSVSTTPKPSGASLHHISIGPRGGGRGKGRKRIGGICSRT